MRSNTSGISRTVVFAAVFLAIPVLEAATFTVTAFTDTAATAGGSVPGTGAGVAGDLRDAINQANTAGGTNTIVFTCGSPPCTVTLAGPLPPITSNLTIDGATLGNIIIDGANAYRVFFVDVGTVTLSNLQIQNATAKGGNGGNGHLGCGGGGAGLGGGLFVNGVTAAVSVTLLNSYFLNNTSTGGTGCARNGSSDSGGGGGLGANGGDGGLIPAGPEAGTLTNGGGGGVLGPGAPGSTADTTAAAGGLGGGGSSDQNGNPGAAVAAAGAGYATNTAGSVGGGTGGNGGFGGGGGAAVSSGGSGGFGGGGGGAEGDAGNGGSGGGGGGALIGTAGGGGLLFGAVTGGAGASTAGGNAGSSGGGAAAGPDIFVNQGTLTVSGSYSLGEAAVGGTAGTGAAAGTADSTAIFNLAGSINGSLTKGPIAGLLSALAAPTLVATFIPSTVTVGSNSILTFTASNANPIALTTVAFSNTVPAGITEVTQTGGTCSTLAGTGGGTFSINPGAGTMTSSSNLLAGLSSCTITIKVLGASVGAPVDTSSTITSAETAAGTAATATLTVNAVAPPPPPPPTFVVSPQSVNLVYAQGTQPSTFSQSYSVSSSAGGTPFTVSVSPASAVAASTGWLTVSPSGNAGTTYTVTVNPGTLTPGNVSATLNFSSSAGAASATLNLMVTPPPTLASQPAVNLSGTFGAVGTAALATQDVQLTSTNANVAFTAASNASWLTFTSSGGSTPATIHVQASSAGLPAGNYQGAIVVTVPGATNSPYSIAVNFAIGTGLLPGQTAIDNAASFTTGDAAPSTILSLFANGLGCTPNPVVTVSGVVAQVLYASGSQINFVVPDGIATGNSAVVQVACGTIAVDTVTIPLAAVDPAIFTAASTGKGPGSIENQNGSVNTVANPASRNSYIAVYGTGFGALNPPSADGLRRTAFPVTATIGGVSATVVYAGEAPTETTGLQQINVLVPAGVTPGAALPIVLTVNGVDTQAGVTVAVQ